MLREERNVVHHLLSLQFAAPPKGVGGAEPLLHQPQKPIDHEPLLMANGRSRPHVEWTVPSAAEVHVRQAEDDHVHSDTDGVPTAFARAAAA